jgi:hypothetical protein
LKNFYKALMAFLMFALLIGIISQTATAGTPPVIPTKPPGTGGGSSGGGGGGSSYSAPTFQPYTRPLNSSDGTVIGRFDGKNFNSVMVHAEKNSTLGNMAYDLTLDGELSSQPPDNSWLDINFQEPGVSGLPPGMENGLMFGTVNVTKSAGGWSYKSSPAYTFTISGITQAIDPAGIYYMVRSDGTGYQVQKVNVTVSGSQVTIKFNPSGDTGLFTVVSAPMATPTPTSTPTPTPTPVSGFAATWGFPAFLIMFVVGVIAGASVLFLIMRNR